jgi:anti-sigma factor RsiW
MQHLDEGTIHAWLDGQLPRDEAQRVEAHVAECRQCADAVAEARGLIAASSRILTALDGVPREVVPKQAASFRAAEEAARAADVVADAFVPLQEAVRPPHRRWFKGASLAAAAAIVVAVGTVTVMQRSGRDVISTVAERASPSVATPGPSVLDSTTAVVAAPVPQAPSATPAPIAAETKSLGDERGATADRQVAVTPPNARDLRNTASNEFVPRATSDSGIESVTVLKESAARALYGARAASSEIRIRGSSALRGVDSANKPADRLAKDKDAKQEVQVAQQAPAQPASAQQQSQAPRREPFGATVARADTGRADQSKQVAAVAVAGKTAATGVIAGRVTDANKTGLANAMVTVAGTNTGVATNAAGEFTIAGVQAGSQKLNVRRIGYEQANRDVTVAAGQTLQADVVLNPSRTELSSVVVTGAAGLTQTRERANAAPALKPAAPPTDAPPGAPITAAQSNAVGCYELGITALMATRNTFRGMPRRIALDSEIVPANAEGVWYRARDLAKTNVQPNGLWRPTGPDGIEIEWTYGSRTARVRVAGPAGSMMRGNLEEVDRATANGEAANVVAVRRPCES